MRFVAELPIAFWNNGLPLLMFGEKGEFEPDLPKLPRGLPVSGDWELRSLKLLLRGVERWYRGGVT